jgi:hypothetical protein
MFYPVQRFNVFLVLSVFLKSLSDRLKPHLPVGPIVLVGVYFSNGKVNLKALLAFAGRKVYGLELGSRRAWKMNATLLGRALGNPHQTSQSRVLEFDRRVRNNLTNLGLAAIDTKEDLR